MRIRATVLLLFWLPVCSAAIVSFTLLALFSFTGGGPLDRSDWIIGGMFFVLSLVVVWFSLKAAVRVYRGGESQARWIAKASPVLVTIGVLLGLWGAFSIQRSHKENSELVAHQQWCGRRGDHSCIVAATACLNRAWQGERAPAANVERLRTRLSERRTQASKEAERRAKETGWYDDDEVVTLDRQLEGLQTHVHAASEANQEVARFVGLCVLTGF